MSTIFLKIPSKAPFDMDAFKARYLELTGEGIQSNIAQNTQETHYLIGSSRLTQEVADQLSSEFPLVSNMTSFPASWQEKYDE